jgi:5-methylcytosine-specific restriction endonuclease McrA
MAAYVPILREVQSSRCFYCQQEIRSATVHVDHFIPWTTYPINLGHNFVLADSACNAAKSDHLAAQQHLERWSSRNRDIGSYLSAQFDRVGLFHDVHASQAIAE